MVKFLPTSYTNKMLQSFYNWSRTTYNGLDVACISLGFLLTINGWQLQSGINCWLVFEIKWWWPYISSPLLALFKIFTAQKRQKNKHEQHSVKHPQQVEAREAKIDSTKQPSSVLPHPGVEICVWIGCWVLRRNNSPVKEEENGVYEIVSTTTNIQLPRPNLFRIDMSKLVPSW